MTALGGLDGAESLPLSALASLDMEVGILGALLLDNAAFDRVADLVDADDFFSEWNALVFAEIARQLMSGRAADVLTVGDALAARGVSLADLHALTVTVLSAANARRYAETIRERALSRKLMQTASRVVELAQDHGRTIGDRIEAAQGELAQLLPDGGSGADWVDAGGCLAEQLDVLNDRAEGKTTAMATGLADLDEFLEGGVRPGELVIIGARPSMGKTALAMTIGLHMAEHYAVGMLSMEMPRLEVSDRMVAILGRVSLSSVKRPARGLDWDRVVDAADRARVLNFFVSDQGGLNIHQVRAKARGLKRKHGLHVLLVDYIGLMNGLDSRQPRAYQLEEISRGLKTLAKELGMAVICLAQVNRKVEERADATPSLSDLRDSGAIEQDADVVLFVHRPIQAKPDLGEEWNHFARVNVAKNRNGRCGVFSLSYIGDQTRFGLWQGDAPAGRSVRGRGMDV